MGKRRSPDEDPEHRMGQRCGYTLKDDGRIVPAPTYVDQLDQCSSERSGINDLMKLFSSHCADLLAEINRRQARVWKSICEDYGLDKETHDIYFDGTYITTKPKSVPVPDSASPVISTEESR